MNSEELCAFLGNCRWFSAPAGERKYYLPDRRDDWANDTDEIHAMIDIFDCVAESGDPLLVEKALEGLKKYSDDDDEGVAERMCGVLLRHLDAKKLLGLFDADNGLSEDQKYILAVTARDKTLFGADQTRADGLYLLLKGQVKALLKTEEPGSERLFAAATLLGEFGDSRAIPLLRRYCGLLLDAGTVLPQGSEEFAEYREKFNSMNREVERLGGKP